MEYKTSFYLIKTGILDETDATPKRLIYATRTGSVLLIKDVYFDYLERNELDQLPPALLSELAAIEAIVPANQDELDYVLQDNQQAVEDHHVLDIVIQPGASCQLGCHYCGQEHTNNYMPADLQQKMIARIGDKLRNEGAKKLSITWYGAEPLMAVKQIREMSEPLLALTDALGLKYSANMITNGLSLKPSIFKEMVGQWRIRHFQITLDGVAAYHDKNRYTKKGQPTFDLIFKNILDIVSDPFYEESKARITIRCNVDRNNEAGIDEFIQLLASYNLQEKVGFYMIPVHNWGENKSGDTVGVNKHDFASEEIDWMLKLINNGFQTEILPGRSKIVCSTVKKGSEVYDAYGNVSTCWEVPYTSSYKDTAYEIGHLDQPFEEDTSKTPMRDWNTTLKEGKTWCAKCKLLPVCGGSCPIHWESGIPACPSFKFNIEDRLVLEYIQSRQQKEVVR